MVKSVDKELAALRDKLGVPPLADVISGVHHLRYLIPPGSGFPLVREYLDRTAFRLTGHYVQTRTRSQHFLLRLPDREPAIIIEETTDLAPGAVRLSAIAFTTSDPEKVQTVLARAGQAVHRDPAGLTAGPLPGLEISFSYVNATGAPWFEGDEFKPGLDVSMLNSLAPRDVNIHDRIGPVDHIAFRIRLQDLEAAATQLMRFTPFRFTDCYTVGDENAETMVFRHGDRKLAIVISYGWDESSVVWGYVAKYGPRVHHTAFYTEDLPMVEQYQRQRGIRFTTEKIIGNPARGILQIFTAPSALHDEITEYVQRFGDFTGFFDPGNVGELMASTKPYNQ